MKITYNGLEQVLETLEEIIDMDGLERQMGLAVALVEREAKMKAPRGSGDLARSITSRVDASDGEVIGTVFTPLFYAPYVEYGTGLFAEDGNGRKDVPWHYQDDSGEWHTTSGQKPQPFMRPALDENREQILRLLSEGVIDD